MAHAVAHSWDPDRYLKYADERGRPFVELLARVGADDPVRVVDLGCGPGNLTTLLARRWPVAYLKGIDSSAEMVAAAVRDHGDVADFEVGDLRAWEAVDGAGTTDGEPGVDVLVSNATLQWLPDHLELLPRLVAQIRPGGWLAFQVPGNFEEPSHTIRRDLAAKPGYAAYTADVAVPSSHDPTTYLEVLTGLGCSADVWETTYLHVLDGDDPDPVFTWVSGTGAQPTLQALPDGLREEFEDEFKRRLRAAYPAQKHGMVLPFRRIFCVARVSTGSTTGSRQARPSA